uniref:Uncharacterized protein n=1 Tax=Romanomermis culicivorax TaxID=13658 RepID=A0A915JGI5_ROMCU
MDVASLQEKSSLIVDFLHAYDVGIQCPDVPGYFGQTVLYVVTFLENVEGDDSKLDDSFLSRSNDKNEN